MRISFSDIEEVRRDPSGYLERRKSPNQGFFGNSKFYTMQLAVYRYHKLNSDLDAVHKYLEESFYRHFKERRDLPKYIEKLEHYASDFNQSRRTVIKVKDRLSLPLKEDLPQVFKVSGEIPRLDLNIETEGYTAWLFAKETKDWENELRLPLIQSAYAEVLSAPLDEIRIGVYDFSTGKQWSHSFSEKEVKKAEISLKQLLQRITELIRGS